MFLYFVEKKNIDMFGVFFFEILVVVLDILNYIFFICFEND